DLALADGDVEQHALGPASIPPALVVPPHARHEPLALLGHVHAGAIAESERARRRFDARESDLVAHLIEVHVARVLDRAEHVETAVPLVLPTAERAAAKLVGAVARGVAGLGAGH